MQFKLIYVLAATLLTSVCAAPVKIGSLDIEARSSEPEVNVEVRAPDDEPRGCRMYSCFWYAMLTVSETDCS
ncbi:hypothetical protein C8R43DRAFT_1127819 [Mycena crocata]|nr:hypothetical protein C8R43DRAFT_1127819 [Mycena crocata]